MGASSSAIWSARLTLGSGRWADLSTGAGRGRLARSFDRLGGSLARSARALLIAPLASVPTGGRRRRARSRATWDDRAARRAAGASTISVISANMWEALGLWGMDRRVPECSSLPRHPGARGRPNVPAKLRGHRTIAAGCGRVHSAPGFSADRLGRTDGSTIRRAHGRSSGSCAAGGLGLLYGGPAVGSSSAAASSGVVTIVARLRRHFYQLRSRAFRSRAPVGHDAHAAGTALGFTG